MTEDQNRTYDSQYLLRLPSEMRDRIKNVAADNNRSMNAEIVATLSEAYPEKTYRIIDAYTYIEDVSKGLSELSDSERLKLYDQIRRKLSSSSLSVALSSGCLNIISTTAVDSKLEFSVAWLKGALLPSFRDDESSSFPED